MVSKAYLQQRLGTLGRPVPHEMIWPMICEKVIRVRHLQ